MHTVYLWPCFGLRHYGYSRRKKADPIRADADISEGAAKPVRVAVSLGNLAATKAVFTRKALTIHIHVVERIPSLPLKVSPYGTSRALWR